ncbi:hypothetical protein SAMN05444000_10922 [Shimia gijangensis]|uniref:CAAX prenyl protease 2/Lysostaphin resistance protein A-like domain-containing protein n=1 Tax=Shimia gijangensis TaxID=1470563 RepID=A0A1M6JHA4_9RHOB|nr:CPBP family intramembrane glutamic endopeptidase [Shimia gijangensis]SHJ46077.1 hypothetical protein SAMN05444000_10922 [Shimia gijangensis]
MSAYRLHEVLVSQARPSASLGKLFGGLALIVVGFLILNVIYFQALQNLPNWPVIRAEFMGGTTARALWLMLLNFAPLLIALGLVVHMLHNRSLANLAGPRVMLFMDFRRVLRATIVLFAVVLLIPGPENIEPVRNMSFNSWLLLVPISLPLIFLQVSTEELLFRGYLQSQLAARFSSPLVWMVLPSLLFGLLHYDPGTYGPNALLLAGWSVLFGLAAADLTARAGNLGPALALHFANNVSAMMFSSMQDYWDGLSLYVLPFGPDAVETLRMLMPIEVMVILCSWLVARTAIRR